MSTYTPGRLYCFVTSTGDGDVRFQGLYWFGGDGRWYDADTYEEKHLDFDVLDTMVEQLYAFDADMAALKREVAV